jgi:hypothetical protein
MFAYGVTTFCDDIRDEVCVKKTLVGVYGAELLLYSDFPAILPKFGIFVQLRFEPVTVTSATLHIYFPGKEAPLITQQLPIPPVENTNTVEYTDKEVTPTMSANYSLILSPVELENEGLIKVRAEINGQIIKAGTLSIKKATPPSSAS